MKLYISIKQITLLIFFVIGQTSFLWAQAPTLIDYTYLGKFSQEMAKQTLQQIPPLNELNPQYSLDLYKIRYQTSAPNGEKVNASGLVAMPENPITPVGIVSYHHGTHVTRTDAPSNHDAANYIYSSVFGSSGGYMVVMPDYLGFGDSELLHPYVQSETLANTSIDMLIAAKELATGLHYPINDTLFLTGYSEGGFTTVVMYEALLKKHPEIAITAVAPGSAPYDWNETMHFVIEKPGPHASAYAAFFFYSMQAYYHPWSGLDTIFQKPYDTLIPSLFDGNHTFAQILQALPPDPHALLQKAFLESILNNTNPYNEQLIKNFNHYDFKSTSPLLLIGTKGDRDVPYHGAEIAYQQLKSQSNNVYLKHVSDTLDHVEAIPYVLKEILSFFKSNEH